MGQPRRYGILKATPGVVREEKARALASVALHLKRCVDEGRHIGLIVGEGEMDGGLKARPRPLL